jgi:tRNA pseudouridine55 synthase
MTGILNIDKAQGLTSHDVVARLRRICGIRRIGHAGTLDPLATGVLLVCVGSATRLSEYLMGQPKTYETTVRLGQTTTTYDTEGEITAERPFNHLTHADIEAALAEFRGPLAQIPPIYSAIKVNGQPMYKLARQGKTVERQPRAVTIYALDLLAWNPPDLRLRVACSSGTYIRSLGYDLGERLGCGGHLTALRRTAVGDFQIAQAVSLEALTPDNWLAHTLPPDQAVAHLLRLDVGAEESEALLQGKQITRQPHHPQAELARVYQPSGVFLGLVERQDNAWQPKKIFPPQPEKIE